MTIVHHLSPFVGSGWLTCGGNPRGSCPRCHHHLAPCLLSAQQERNKRVRVKTCLQQRQRCCFKSTLESDQMQRNDSEGPFLCFLYISGGGFYWLDHWKFKALKKEPKLLHIKLNLVRVFGSCVFCCLHLYLQAHCGISWRPAAPWWGRSPSSAPRWCCSPEVKGKKKWPA